MATYKELLEAYDTNADYEEVGSVAKCRAFITACRRLLSPGVSPKRSVHGGRGAEEIEVDLTVLRDQLNAAQQWLADYDAGEIGSHVVHSDFTNFRD